MNTNPQAIAFCNSRVRVTADSVQSAVATMRQFVTEWRSQGIAAVIPSDAEVVDDGSAADGRPPITNRQVRKLKDLCDTLLATFDAADADGGKPTIDRVSSISVNGQARF